MQIGDWGNVLIRHVHEWKHWKHSPWACPFFRGRISKNNISPPAPDLELMLFPLWYWPIMNALTKQQQDKVFETDFIDSQKSDPPFAHLLALSHICFSLLFFIFHNLSDRLHYFGDSALIVQVFKFFLIFHQIWMIENTSELEMEQVVWCSGLSAE